MKSTSKAITQFRMFKSKKGFLSSNFFSQFEILYNIKKYIVVLLFFLVFSNLFSSHHIPGEESGGNHNETENTFYFQGRLALLLNYNNWNPVFSVLGDYNWEHKEISYKSITTGTYYRLFHNLKIGVFYILQAGALHNNDWVNGSDNLWRWEDTSKRFENLLSIDLSPRFLLKNIPGRNWVLIIKSRYFYNFHNDNQSLLLRPGLTYFYILEREPVLNISGNYGTYLNFNNPDSLIYKHGPYLNLLYHLTSNFKLELQLTYTIHTWSVDEGVNNTDSKYKVKENEFKAGLGILYKFP